MLFWWEIVISYSFKDIIITTNVIPFPRAQ